MEQNSLVGTASHVRLIPYSICSASFFSRNSIFLSQQFNQNSVFQPVSAKILSAERGHKWLITDRWNRSGTYSNGEIQRGLYWRKQSRSRIYSNTGKLCWHWRNRSHTYWKKSNLDTRPSRRRRLKGTIKFTVLGNSIVRLCSSFNKGIQPKKYSPRATHSHLSIIYIYRWTTQYPVFFFEQP